MSILRYVKQLLGINGNSATQWFAATQMSVYLHIALLTVLMIGSTAYVRFHPPQQGQTSIVVTMTTLSRSGSPPRPVRIESKSEVHPLKMEHLRPVSTTPVKTRRSLNPPKIVTSATVNRRTPSLPAEATVPILDTSRSRLDVAAKPPQPHEPVRRRTKKRHKPAAPSRVALSSLPKVPGVQRRAPKITYVADVEYPADALAARQTGQVTVLVVISAKGIVSRARLNRSSGYKSLDEAGVKTARQYRFEPGQGNRRVRIVIPFRIIER